ncbi:unnamed protein product [Anisakis simplex]|uniref:Transposase n=1 Tax=Anisakis simplex TaxID=6269 RepID=A0A0M3JKP7_ANISI|nr:unnamed protein product [Anisakis simplex]
MTRVIRDAFDCTTVICANQADGYFVVPKFDKIAAGICIGLWFVMQSCGTNVEV